MKQSGRFNVGADVDSGQRFPILPALYVASDRTTAHCEMFGHVQPGSGLSAEALALQSDTSILWLALTGIVNNVFDLTQERNLVPFLKATSIFRDVDAENTQLAELTGRLATLTEQLRGVRGEAAALQLNKLLPLPWVDKLQLIDIAKIQAMKINVDELAQELVQFDRVVREIRQGRVNEALEISTQDVVAQQVGVEQLVTAELQKELDARAAARQAAHAFEVSQEHSLQQTLQSLRASTFSAAIGALQAFAGHSKSAARAIVIANKAVAIAQVVQNTAAAATKALAIYGPTPLGFNAATTAKAFGALQIAAIAAAGVGEIQNINRSGGAPIGSPSNPVNMTSAGSGDQQFGASPRSAVQVIVQGNVVGNQEFIDKLIEEISDAVDDRDVILIKPTSRNAQDIVGT